ncbi:hypothetical protein Nepgr_023963 [Nepenthes gracilis]|uniref:Uncharacterized protein n=1 Tax=Nepenthes gracilis TaxID=150966 RepID=A0AAD3T3F9_NEPGR|nr:hypothetical protein Nepgr_023963 [Nepenthes gracilis]
MPSKPPQSGACDLERCKGGVLLRNRVFAQMAQSGDTNVVFEDSSLINPLTLLRQPRDDTSRNGSSSALPAAFHPLSSSTTQGHQGPKQHTELKSVQRKQQECTIGVHSKKWEHVALL